MSVLVKRVLFVCVENANRSQMAEAFARIHGGAGVEAYSAGSEPSGVINPRTIEAMRELGYDLSRHAAKSLAEIPDVEYDFVATIGCGDACPMIHARRWEDWNIPDLQQPSQDEFRKVRDLIESKVKAALAELGVVEQKELEMEPITGTASVIEQSDMIAPAGPPYTYLGVAESLMPGVKILAAVSPVPVFALAFVAAHVLECLLKAYLSRGGSDAAVKGRNKHDLNALWATAFKQGLRVPEPPPSWADRLGGLHKGPYYLRYSENSKGAHGIVSPGAEPMTSELAALLEIVRGQLR